MDIKARGKRPTAPRNMNKLEKAWADQLFLLLRAGEIMAYEYEAIKLRLADNTTFTPDFFVIDSEGYVEFHEVKGFWREDARVKIKVAKEKYPWFRFIAITKIKGVWKEEEF